MKLPRKKGTGKRAARPAKRLRAPASRGDQPEASIDGDADALEAATNPELGQELADLYRDLAETVRPELQQKLSKIWRARSDVEIPASAMRRHVSKVRGDTEPYRNEPVSVAIPRYRWAAMAGVHGTPSASMTSATCSAHAAAELSNQLTVP